MEETKLLQDFLDRENLQINQGEFIVKRVDGGGILIEKPIVTVSKKQLPPEEQPKPPVVEGEAIPNES